MTSLFQNIKWSIHGPAYYNAILLRPFSYSLKYFFSLAIAISVLMAGTFALSTAPSARSFLETGGKELLSHYPSELEITFKNGEVSTSVKEPYAIPIPEKAKKEVEENAKNPIENIIVIDTTVDPTVEGFKGYRTLLLLTKNTLVTYDKERVVFQPLAEVPDFVINKAIATTILTNFIGYLGFLGPVVVFGLFFVFLGAITLKLIYLALFSLLTWVYLKNRGVDPGYKKSFQVGLHLITLSLLVEYLLLVIFGPLRVPFLFTVLTVIALIINFPRRDTALIAPKESESA